jgi:hypothetical protein
MGNLPCSCIGGAAILDSCKNEREKALETKIFTEESMITSTNSTPSKGTMLMGSNEKAGRFQRQRTCEINFYEPQKIYYGHEVVNSQNQTENTPIQDKQINEMIVCKTYFSGPWFIRINTGISEEDDLNLHYVDVG